MYYKDRRGICLPYQEKDLRYDTTQGYLQKEGAGQGMKEGVLHRGPVGASKRGRARVGVYSLGPEERQEAGSSTTLGAG